MFWLLFVFVAGVLIMLISTTPESIGAVNQMYQPRSNGYALLEWRSNHALHLQRMAHEDLGVHDWVLGSWNIPITTTDVKLAVFKDKRLPQLLGRTENSSFEDGTGKVC